VPAGGRFQQTVALQDAVGRCDPVLTLVGVAFYSGTGVMNFAASTVLRWLIEDVDTVLLDPSDADRVAAARLSGDPAQTPFLHGNCVLAGAAEGC